MCNTFQRPAVILLPDGDSLVNKFQSPNFVSSGEEARAAARVFEHGQPAGSRIAELPTTRTRYLPLKTWRGTVGVLGLQFANPDEKLVADQEQLLGAFVNQAALAITRALLTNEAKRVEVLQQADKLQKALLNSISHNLRTPLASVTGAISSVLEDGHLLDSSTQRRLLETAHDESRRLNRLVQNLLDMTRLEGGAVHVKREPCDVQDVIGSTLMQLGELAGGRQITVAVPADLPLISMDSGLIVQVLVNLLDNALKYSSPGSAVEVEACIADDQLRVRGSNQGSGIPEEELERVFEKFYRGKSAGTSTGVGLGLCICKGLIEAHRGRIWVESAQERSEVRFRIPIGRV